MGFAVFTRRSADFCPEFPHIHKLHSVANAKHGHAEVEQLIGAGREPSRYALSGFAGQNKYHTDRRP